MQKELTKEDRKFMRKHDLTEDDMKGFKLDMEMEALRDREETLKAIAEENARESARFGYAVELD